MNFGQTIVQKTTRAGILAMALLACALLATACSAGGSASSPSTGSTGSSSANTSSSSASASAVASQASSASVKDAIEISNAKLEQDAIGRYVLTATVSNSGNESLDVKLDGKASLTKREKNKYNEEEEFTSVEKISGYESVTPWVSGGDSITILGLKAGEKRELTVYPTSVGGVGSNLCQTNNTASDPELIVSNVSPTAEANKLSDVPDFDTNLKVEITSFDGKKVSGTVTNNTGKYLTSASLAFTKWDSSNLPITNKPMRDQRPIGADLKTEVVKNLKPGATAEFNVVLGDCDTVKLKDVHYDVDQAKS